MKKLLVLALALILALGCVSALAEEATEYDIRALIWKYDDTYGSSVRQAMMAAAEEIGAELGITINLTMYDAADDMAKQVEQATILVGEKPDFVIINLAEVASGQQLVDMFTEAGIPYYTGADSFVTAGALATCGVNYDELGAATADLALEVLDTGTVPEYQIVPGGIITVNSETAAALGIDPSVYTALGGELVEVTTAE